MSGIFEILDLGWSLPQGTLGDVQGRFDSRFVLLVVLWWVEACDVSKDPAVHGAAPCKQNPKHLTFRCWDGISPFYLDFGSFFTGIFCV